MMARPLLLSSSAERSESKLAKSMMQMYAGELSIHFNGFTVFFFWLLLLLLMQDMPKELLNSMAWMELEVRDTSFFPTIPRWKKIRESDD